MTRGKASLLALAATAVTVTTLFLLPFTPRVAVRSVRVEGGTLARTRLLEGVVAYLDEAPCVAAQAGRVARVNARPGQQVEAGDLLFTMDTGAQEAALAAAVSARSRMQELLPASGQALPELSGALTAEGELRAAVAAAQVRAPADGVVDSVYVREGSYVSAMSVLGVVRGERRCVQALAHAADVASVQPGAAAAVYGVNGQELGLAELVSAGAPTLDGSAAVRQCAFALQQEEALAGVDIGERVTLELLYDVCEAQALVPISAIDGNDEVWVVRDGKAWPCRTVIGRRNAQYAVADAALRGERVILTSERLKLYPGCPVKEAGE